MRPTLGSRLRALVLTAVVLGGGMGVPALDIALFHLGRPGSYRLVTAVGSTSTGASHADRCVLGAMAAISRPAHRFDVRLHVATPARDGQPFLRTDVPRSTRLPSRALPRAPPVDAA
jgi:hypothetical protein